MGESPHHTTRVNYNRLSRIYDRLAGNSERAFRLRGITLLDVQPGERVLEIGAGTGEALVTLAHATGRTGLACGIDLSEGMLHVVQHRLRRHGSPPQAKLCQADTACLPLAPGCLDAIFISFTLEIFSAFEIPLVLEECHRVLRPEGRMLLIVLARPQRPGLAVRLYEWLHDRLPTLIDCRPILAQPMLTGAGFHIAASSCHTLWGLPVETLLACKKS